MAQPTREHAWLERFVGAWELELDMPMGPGKPTMKTRGSEQARMLGGFWLVSEGQNNDFPFRCMLTLGYDSRKLKYVGSWIDTMTNYLWRYEGSVDPSGRILTLETQGPSPMAPDHFTKFREVTEFLSDDHRVFTSSMLDEEGNWQPCLTIHFHRKR